MLKRIFLVVLWALLLVSAAQAQTEVPSPAPTESATPAEIAPAPALGPIQTILQTHLEAIEKSSRKTIGPAIDAVATSGLPQAQAVLEAWQAKDMWQRKSDGLFFRAEKAEGSAYTLIDFDTGEAAGTADKADIDQLKPNSGIRALIGTALVTFQLNDPSRAKRADALTSLERDANADLLVPLRASIEPEEDPGLKARKQRLERLLTISYDPDPEARIAAIGDMAGDTGLDVRGVLNPLVATTLEVFEGEPPERSYADKKGKYQKQTGITLPKL